MRTNQFDRDNKFRFGYRTMQQNQNHKIESYWYVRARVCIFLSQVLRSTVPTLHNSCIL